MPVSFKFKDLFEQDYTDPEPNASKPKNKNSGSKKPKRLKPKYEPWEFTPPVPSHASPDDPVLHRPKGLVDDVNPTPGPFKTRRSLDSGYLEPPQGTNLQDIATNVQAYINNLITKIKPTPKETKEYDDIRKKCNVYDKVRRLIYHPDSRTKFVPADAASLIEKYYKETHDESAKDLFEWPCEKVPDVGVIVRDLRPRDFDGCIASVENAYQKACTYFQDKDFESWEGHSKYLKDLADLDKTLANEREIKDPEWLRKDGKDSPMIRQAKDYWNSKCELKRSFNTKKKDDKKIPKDIKDKIDELYIKLGRGVYNDKLRDAAKDKVFKLLRDFQKEHDYLTQFIDVNEKVSREILKLKHIGYMKHEKSVINDEGFAWDPERLNRKRIERDGHNILNKIMTDEERIRYKSFTEGYDYTRTLIGQLNKYSDEVSNKIQAISELEHADPNTPYDYLDQNSHWPHLVTKADGSIIITPPHDEQSARDEAILGNYKSLMDTLGRLRLSLPASPDVYNSLSKPIRAYQGLIHNRMEDYSSKLDEIWAKAKEETTPVVEDTGKETSDQAIVNTPPEVPKAEEASGAKIPPQTKGTGKKTTGENVTGEKRPRKENTGKKRPRKENTGKKRPRKKISDQAIVNTPPKVPKAEEAGDAEIPPQTKGTGKKTTGGGNDGKTEPFKESVEHFNQVFATTIMKSSKERLTQRGRRYGQGVTKP